MLVLQRLLISRDSTPNEIKSHRFSSERRLPKRISFSSNRNLYIYISISDVIKELATKFDHQERYKNGRVLKSLSTSRKYRYLNALLHQFTRSKYHQDFCKYRFCRSSIDITIPYPIKRK